MGDYAWRCDLRWFHTAFHGFIACVTSLHAAAIPSAVIYAAAALNGGSFALRLACQATLERRAAERTSARLLVLPYLCTCIVAMVLQSDDPRAPLRQMGDGRLLSGFLFLIWGVAIAVQPVSTGERLATLCLVVAFSLAAMIHILHSVPPIDLRLLGRTVSWLIVPIATGYCGTHVVEEFVIRPKAAQTLLELDELRKELLETQTELRESEATMSTAVQLSATIESHRARELRARKKREIELRQRAEEVSRRHGRSSTNQLLRALGVPVLAELGGVGRMRAIREELFACLMARRRHFDAQTTDAEAPSSDRSHPGALRGASWALR